MYKKINQSITRNGVGISAVITRGFKDNSCCCCYNKTTQLLKYAVPKNLLNIIIFYDEVFCLLNHTYKHVMMSFVWMPGRNKVTRFICMATINQIIKRKLIFICMFYSIVSLSLFCFHSKFETLCKSFCLVKWCWHNQINTEKWDKAEKINDRISSNVQTSTFHLRAFICNSNKMAFPSLPSVALALLCEIWDEPTFYWSRKMFHLCCGIPFSHRHQFCFLSLSVSVAGPNYPTNINKFKLKMIYAALMKANAWPYVPPKHNSLNFNATNI